MATKKLTKPKIPTSTVKPRYEFKCTMCGLESNSAKSFYAAQSKLYKGNDGLLNICRNCCSQLFKDLLTEYDGNELYAMDRFCQMNDIYFSPDIVDSANSEANLKENYISAYMKKINLVQYKFKTYSDTITEHSGVINGSEDLNKVNADGKILAEQTVDFFGPGFTPSEYKYLQDQYNDWITRHECNTKAQEELFKALSIAQLAIRKTASSGDSKARNEAIKAFQDLLGTANLQPKQTKGADSAMIEANTLGTLIEKWENDKPIPDPDPDFQDVDGIKHFITVWFLGHLCKMLGIKNDAAEEYEREKSKYDVDKPDFMEEEQENSSIKDALKAAMEKGEE